MEIWKEILPDYFVSTLGNIESTKKVKRRRLKGSNNESGYPTVRIRIDGELKYYRIHRLVAQAFIPNPEGKPEVNHINGIKTDNRVENLEWVTPSENRQHAYDTGLAPSGEKHYLAKFSERQITYIRDNPESLTQSELGKMFNSTQETISDIQLGKKYRQAGGLVREPKFVRSHIPNETRAEIRRLYVKGSHEFGTVALAKMFHTTPQTIWNIIREND